MFRLLDWNILSYLFTKPPDFQWELRFPKIRSFLKEMKPDLLHLQECQLETRAVIVKETGLKLVPTGWNAITEATQLATETSYRTGTGIFQGVKEKYNLLMATGYSLGIPCFYNPAKFTLIAYNVAASYKLSTEDTGILPTVYQKYTLRDTEGNYFLCCNVHLSNNSSNKDAHVAKIVSELQTLPSRIILVLDTITKYEILVSGDFNYDSRWTSTWKRMINFGLTEVVNLEDNPSKSQGLGLAEPTRHENGWTVGCTHIDYIWVSKGIKTQKMFISRYSAPPWPSDHFPLIADLQI